MDPETAHYIVHYFTNLLTDQERMAIKHTISLMKLGSSTGNLSNLERVYWQRGWLTSEQSVLDLIKDGYDAFERRAALRLLQEHRDEVFLNRCPVCGRLARTPVAKQCRCGHDWH